MNRQERSQRFTLTVFFSAVVFFALTVTLIIAGLLVFLLNRWGLFVPDGQAELSSLALILLMMGLSLVVGTITTVVVIRFPLSPVNSLLDGMRKLSQGNYQARINIGFLGKHQLGFELVDSFNLLASELESTEMLRSDFINNFSHEFKTPIVSIAGFAKLLKYGNLSEAQKAEYLDVIENESLRLSELATNVLNLTKVENQMILTEISEYNLSEQLRTCILMLENKWVRKQLELTLDFDEHSVRANKELLSHVWINIIDNAIKFSPEKGCIEIRVGEDDSCVWVSVINTGVEITDADKIKIFTKFYQADQSHSGDGNGIGLAVVKKIVELHGGKVEVESSGGKNTFTVKLEKNIIIADAV